MDIILHWPTASFTRASQPRMSRIFFKSDHILLWFLASTFWVAINSKYHQVWIIMLKQLKLKKIISWQFSTILGQYDQYDGGISGPCWNKTKDETMVTSWWLVGAIYQTALCLTMELLEPELQCFKIRHWRTG